jgi:FemAB family protein
MNAQTDESFDLYAKTWSMHGFELRPREPEKPDWDNFLREELHYIPTCYSNKSLSYQLAYQQGAGGRWLDLSAIVCKGGSSLAALPLSISKQADLVKLGSHGLPLLPPLFADHVPPRLRKNCVKSYLDVLQNLAGLSGCCEFISEEIVFESANFSEWHMEAMQQGARATLFHELYVDLRKPIEEIKAQIRRRYRSLVNVGLREWSSEVWFGNQCSRQYWEEFGALHLQVAGRVTRAASTWEHQFEAVKNEQGFVVALRDSGKRLVGAALFEFTTTEASYSVGAYDRALFDKPIGHVAQFIALQEFKRLGLAWYRIGQRPFAKDNPQPTDKELSIGYFKQGFATCAFPKIRLRHPIEKKS